MTAIFALLTGILPAHAETAGVLSKGSQVLYTGAGFTTFGSLEQDGPQGAEVVERDRELRPRLDLYGSLGLADRLQLSLSAPLIYSTVADDPAVGPCPQLLPAEDYCDSYATVGQARVDLRYGLVQSGPRLSVGLAGDVDNWNRNRRGQYNSAGSGTAAAEVFAVTDASIDAGDWQLGALLLGGYAYSFGPTVDTPDGTGFKAPADTIRGSLELVARTPAPLSIELGVHRIQRLGGVELDGQWVSDWFGRSKDRWNVLRYSHLAGSAKLSVDLPQDMGIHLGASRVILVDNGAADLTDVSLGWHKYFAP